MVQLTRQVGLFFFFFTFVNHKKQESYKAVCVGEQTITFTLKGQPSALVLECWASSIWAIYSMSMFTHTHAKTSIHYKHVTTTCAGSTPTARDYCSILFQSCTVLGESPLKTLVVNSHGIGLLWLLLK